MRNIVFVSVLLLLIVAPVFAQDATLAPEVTAEPGIVDVIVDSAQDVGTGALITIAAVFLLAVVLIASVALVALWASAPKWAVDISKPAINELLVPVLDKAIDTLRDMASKTTTTFDDELVAKIDELIKARINETLNPPQEPPQVLG